MTHPALDDLLPRARKYHESAVGALIEAYYPLVFRVAHALCGDPAAARRVVRQVIARSIAALPKFRDGGAADRWFYHYTVLESRNHPAGGTNDDPLLATSTRTDAPYLAFLRALRGLPPQQREAILLNHGEHLNPRYLGVAMDCSVDAAANHLRAATRDLESIGGPQTADLLAAVTQAYRRLAPPPETVRPEIRRRVRRYLWPRRLRRTVLIILLLAAAAAAWYARRRFFH